jgi:hypothetical protein
VNSPAIQFLALSYGASEFLLDFAQLAFLFSLADSLLHLFGVKLGSEQHLLVGGLDFKFEDVLSGKLIEPLFILVDLNLNFDSLRILVEFQLAPEVFNSIEPNLMGVVGVLLKVVAVDAQFWHDDVARESLEELYEFFNDAVFASFAGFVSRVLFLYSMEHFMAGFPFHSIR